MLPPDGVKRRVGNIVENSFWWHISGNLKRGKCKISPPKTPSELPIKLPLLVQPLRILFSRSLKEGLFPSGLDIPSLKPQVPPIAKPINSDQVSFSPRRYIAYTQRTRKISCSSANTEIIRPAPTRQNTGRSFKVVQLFFIEL